MRMNSSKSSLFASAALAALIALAVLPASAQQAAAPAVTIDNDDIGGVVTGPNGPEAGVWVIAETRDLPVRYIKMRRDRRPGPLCRARPAEGELRYLGARLWSGRFSPKVKSEPGKQLNLTAVPAPDEKAAAQYYPAIYWYAMLKIPTADQFGPEQRARHPRKDQAVRLAQRHEEQRLRRLPSARPAVDPHDPEIPHGSRQDARGSLGAPHPVGPVGRADDQSGGRRYRWRAVQVLRRVDRAGRKGRIAVCQADAAAGRRAQHRRHAARLAQPETIPARPDRQRPALSDRQCLRSGLRPVRTCLQRHADPRSW